MNPGDDVVHVRKNPFELRFLGSSMPTVYTLENDLRKLKNWWKKLNGQQIHYEFVSPYFCDQTIRLYFEWLEKQSLEFQNQQLVIVEQFKHRFPMIYLKLLQRNVKFPIKSKL